MPSRLILAFLLCAAYPAAHVHAQSPFLTRIQDLVASDAAISAEFGQRLAISGDVAVIGAPADDELGGNAGAGYVFRRQENGDWVEEAKLLGSDQAAGDAVGYAVATNGEWVALGSPSHELTPGMPIGAVYLFEKQAGGWTEVQKIQASDIAVGDNFGVSVSLSGNRLFVGSQNHDSLGLDNAGAVYFFALQVAGTWAEQQKLVPAGIPEGANFGHSVSISGDRVVVGSPAITASALDPDLGSAYVFARETNGTWVEEAQLLPGDTSPTGEVFFGRSVSLSGTRAAVGSTSHLHQNDPNPPTVGAVYVFKREQNGTWIEEAELLPADGTFGALGQFGQTVTLEGERLIAGGALIPDIAYAFSYGAQGNWREDARLEDTAQSGFGFGCSLSKSHLFVGVPFESSSEGMVAVFRQFEQQPPALNSPLAIDVRGIPGNNPADDAVNAGNTESDGTMSSVVPHSGQVVFDQLDLSVLGLDAATHVEIKRRHTTRRDQPNSIFGPGWAFNYRHYFRQFPSGEVEMFSFGRRDVFAQVSETTNPTTGALETRAWEGLHGRFDRMHYVADDELTTLRLRNGTQLEFHTVNEGDSYLEGILTAVVSPNLNRVELEYQPGDILFERKLLRIIDAFGRDIDFIYDDANNPNQVTRIIDFDGRELLYTYNPNGNGQLLSVRSPLVQSTNGLNDFPSGKTVEYSYLLDPVPDTDPQTTIPVLAYALTSVTYPNQAGGVGPPRYSWTYDETGSPLDNSFYGFVLTHTVGSQTGDPLLDAGGTYSYEYELLSDDVDINTAFILTTVTDRRGTRTELELNHFGHALTQRVFTNLNLRDPEPEFRARQMLYTPDGDLIASTDENGILTTVIPDAGSPVRNCQGNELEKIIFPSSAADQASITYKVVYEPIYNQPFKVVDPRGVERGNEAAFTTTYYYDYMEDLAAATVKFAPELGITEGELSALFTLAGITDQADINQDGTTAQDSGNLIRIAHPTVTLPAGYSDFLSDQIQTAEEIHRYNSLGQLIYHRDPEGNVTEQSYYAGVQYLREVARDTTATPGRNSNHPSTPANQATLFEYGPIGGFPGNSRGIPTSVTDARGTQSIFLVNELDQTVQTRTAFAVSDPQLTAHDYTFTTIYDANNNIVETRTDNSDALDTPADTEVIVTFTYDILDQVRSERLDTGPNGINDIETTYSYDANQNLVSKTRGANYPNDAATETWLYDERNILVEHTRGFGSPEASTTSTEINDNGKFLIWRDASGDESLTIYDGFDRQKTLIDRLGNFTEFTYDSASNVVARESYGNLDHQPGSPVVLLARREAFFDVRNRQQQTNRLIVHYAGKAVGTIDAGAGSAGGGLVTSYTIYDRNSRPIGVIDADGDPYETRYDGLSREIKTIDPLANEVERIYDPSNNLIGVLEIEKSPLLVNDEVFVTAFQYDSLDRLTAQVEPNGQVTEYRYDSRNNLIKQIDPLLNEIEMRHDRLSRLVNTRTYLSATGVAASAGNNDDSQGGGDGVITTAQSWDALHRVVDRTDDNGNSTIYQHDDLDRVVQCSYPDGTSELWLYNADSELLARLTPNGSIESWTYDSESRPIRVDIDNSLAKGTMGTTRKTWGYDGLHRVTRTTDNNGPGLHDDVAYEYFFDSLSRSIREIQRIGSNALVVDSEWQGAHRKVSQTYPNGRRIERSYDALDRLDTILESGSSMIASFEYVGPFRDIRTTYGNGSVLSKLGATGQTTSGSGAGYDGNRRHVRHEWLTAGSNQIASYVNTYNGPGGLGTNRRRTELREHLGRIDVYEFDSHYRMVQFRRNADPASETGGVVSERAFDGADKMIAFLDEGEDRAPEVDTHPGEVGMNQYSVFDGRRRLYDHNSSLVRDGGLTYLYDYDNRLVEIRDFRTGRVVQRNTYCAAGRRVRKESGLPASPGDKATRFIYSGWQVLEERGSNNSVRRQYVEGRSIDEHIQLKDYTHPGSPTFFYHCNSQGSVGALTDENGDVVERYTYGWLGEPKAQTLGRSVSRRLPIANNYFFQGRRFDFETGLYYYRNRFYSPSTGEFLSQDPMGSWLNGQGNGYSAFNEDGWNFSDPMGLYSRSDMLTDFYERYKNGHELELYVAKRGYGLGGTGWDDVGDKPKFGIGDEWEVTSKGKIILDNVFDDEAADNYYEALQALALKIATEEFEASLKDYWSKNQSADRALKRAATYYRAMRKRGKVARQLQGILVDLGLEAGLVPGVVRNMPEGMVGSGALKLTKGAITAFKAWRKSVQATRVVAIGDDVVKYADLIVPKPGFTDIVVHGAKNAKSFVINTSAGKVRWGHEEMAQFIKKNKIKGNIRLVACHVGRNSNMMQNLADELGVCVEAATTVVHPTIKKGYPALMGNGKWKLYKPK